MPIKKTMDASIFIILIILPWIRLITYALTQWRKYTQPTYGWFPSSSCSAEYNTMTISMSWWG